MKGVVFTEFLELVESRFSPDLVDQIIETANPPSGGAYTSVGTYDHQELVALVGALATATGIPAAKLVHTFGEHLFSRFTVAYSGFFKSISNSFQFLSGLEAVIHKEVRKLYPDAELPRFETVEMDDDHMVMLYQSPRNFADLAEGLIAGCIKHFDESISVERIDLASPHNNQTRFTLRRRPASQR